MRLVEVYQNSNDFNRVIPTSMSQVDQVKCHLSKGISSEDAAHYVLPLINSPTIEQSIQDCECDDVAEAIYNAINLEYPMIARLMRPSDPSLRDENIDGTLSALGHKDELPTIIDRMQ